MVRHGWVVTSSDNCWLPASEEHKQQGPRSVTEMAYLTECNDNGDSGASLLANIRRGHTYTHMLDENDRRMFHTDPLFEKM